MDIDSNEIIVYTCLTGDYEIPIPQSNFENEVSYLFFTDNKNLVPTGWKFMPIEGLDDLTNKDKNRFIKIKPEKFLPNHKVSIYIDSNIEIKKNISSLIKSLDFKKNSIFMYEHFSRDCIYKEAEAVVSQGLVSFFDTKKQIARYKEEKLPSNFGLFEANVIIRSNVAEQLELMEFWWKEYFSGSKRDQISLIYSSYKKNIPIKSIGVAKIKRNKQKDLIVDKDYFVLDVSKRVRKEGVLKYTYILLNRILLMVFKI